MKKVITFFTHDRLFLIAWVLAVFACGLGKFELSYIDGKVIFSLFGLMLVIAGLEASGLLQGLAAKLVQVTKNTRQLAQILIALSFFGSMFLTNDVAILTLLPIYLKLLRQLPLFKGRFLGAVLIILAANLGSSFFPFGNPQNLFLFNYYSLSVANFFQITLPLLLVAIVVVLATTFTISAVSLASFQLEKMKIDWRQTLVFSLGLLLMIAAIFKLFPLSMAVLIILLLVASGSWQIFWRIDYQLLLTFVCFFLIVGNISHWPSFTHFLANFLQTPRSTFVTSLGLSQVISNVPAAILLAPFTRQISALLLGVNIGGLGTLVASLANLIGYKLFKIYFPQETKTFFKIFTGVNVGILLLLGVLFGVTL